MRGWIAWVLPERDRALLLKVFPPRYPDVLAHHITHIHGVPDDTALPTTSRARIIGETDDGKGVQALVVDMGHERPGGGTYHITWSIDRAAGRAPKHSNLAIAEVGYEPVTPIVLDDLKASFIPLGK